MKYMRFAALSLVMGLLTVGGCISRPPVLYQLDSGSPTLKEKSSGLMVLLEPVDIADYLNQSDAVLQRQLDGTLMPDRDARWAGNLGDNIDNVMLQRLAGRLSGQRVALEPAAGFEPDIEVRLSISRLDSGPDKPAVLEGQWRLLDRSGKLRDSRLVRLEAAHQGSTADQIRAQSQLLQQLAEQLAGAIEPLSRQIVAARKVRPSEPQAPQIPTVEPIRTDVEIYRF
ncbi:MAG TPA: ABC-type transport auxiliary lipoprotein family protein [Pseudomonas sp.]|uniref:PqiC family protein n=1 Tax=Pseudomonas sp. TaxID=306 RepID=UPI002BE089A2|nr:ABC-type transport auxiliary lipoprotein family protein [Pseudomonas sp.]HTO18507.1 ABC-type transport auxiliary lipoprotein family protein [Pseudomonas sp.]